MPKAGLRLLVRLQQLPAGRGDKLAWEGAPQSCWTVSQANKKPGQPYVEHPTHASSSPAHTMQLLLPAQPEAPPPQPQTRLPFWPGMQQPCTRHGTPFHPYVADILFVQDRSAAGICDRAEASAPQHVSANKTLASPRNASRTFLCLACRHIRWTAPWFWAR